MNLRYPRELRDNVESPRRVLVQTPSGAQIRSSSSPTSGSPSDRR
ncbi:MAG: hypothetical protein U0610_14055 [bacterium]